MQKNLLLDQLQWPQKILATSKEIPTQLTQNPVDPKIYTGGREEGHMNKTIKYHNELARKIIAKYPEVTHFGSTNAFIHLHSKVDIYNKRLYNEDMDKCPTVYLDMDGVLADSWRCGKTLRS